MFRPVEMKKVKIIAPLRYKNTVSSRLHEMGAAHISDVSRRLYDAEWKHVLTGKVGCESRSELEACFNKLDEINAAFDDKKKSRKVSVKIKVGRDDEERIAGRIKEFVRGDGARVLELKDDIAGLNGENEALSEKRKVLDFICGIDADFEVLESSANVSYLFFRVDNEKFEGIKDALDALERIVVEREAFERDSLVLLTYPKAIDDKISKLVGPIDVERIEIPRFVGKPRDEIVRIGKKIRENEERIGSFELEMGELRKRYFRDALALREEAGIILDRHSLLDKCAGTDSSFLLEFFVRREREKEVISQLMKATENRVVVYSVEPLSEELPERVPVLLDNPAIIKPFERLTNMYAVPKYNDLDPTAFMAPGLLLFFGIMLNDVGYGLLLALLGIFVYRRYRDVYMSAESFGVMLGLFGLSSIVFGVVSGGYFGNALRTVLPGIGYLIDPLGDANITLFGNTVENPILAVLVFALVVGVVYINIGYVLGISDCIRKIRHISRRGRKDSIRGLENQIVGHVGIILFELGFFGFLFYWKAGWFHNVSGFLLIDGLFLFTGIFMLAKSGGVQTLFGFFDITGFVGDELSFIRLLALCLATEGVANIVNQFAGFSLGIPYAGIAVGSFIFVAGHSFNLIIGTLGAGIHSLRLQYVEFFSKFFEGGGVEFEPYSVKRKLTEVEA